MEQYTVTDTIVGDKEIESSNETEGTMQFSRLSNRQARHLLQLRTYVRKQQDSETDPKRREVWTNILASILVVAEDEGDC